MSQLTAKLRVKALELSSRLNVTDEQETADLLSDAADEIERLSDAEMRWIERIYDIRVALGCFEKPMLSELGEEVKRVRAADYERGKADAVAGKADEIARLLRCINSAAGCLDGYSGEPDEILAWLRLLDAIEGREPRKFLDGRAP